MGHHYHTHAHHCIHIIGWIFIALAWIWLFTDSTLFWIFMGVGFFLIFLGAFVHYIRLRQLRRHYYDCSASYPPMVGHNAGGGYAPQGYPVYQATPVVSTSVPATPYQPNPVNYETPKPQDYYYQQSNYSNPYPQQQEAPQVYQAQVYSQPPQQDTGGLRPPPQVYQP